MFTPKDRELARPAASLAMPRFRTRKLRFLVRLQRPVVDAMGSSNE
jgi:hypothetical protein